MNLKIIIELEIVLYWTLNGAIYSIKWERLHYQVCWEKLALKRWGLLWENVMRKNKSVQYCFTSWWWGLTWQCPNLSCEPTHSVLWINTAFTVQGMGAIFFTPWFLNTIAMNFQEATLGFLEMLWIKKKLPPGDNISEQRWAITYHKIILTTAECGSIWKL